MPYGISNFLVTLRNILAWKAVITPEKMLCLRGRSLLSVAPAQWCWSGLGRGPGGQHSRATSCPLHQGRAPGTATLCTAFFRSWTVLGHQSAALLVGSAGRAPVLQTWCQGTRPQQAPTFSVTRLELCLSPPASHSSPPFTRQLFHTAHIQLREWRNKIKPIKMLLQK